MIKISEKVVHQKTNDGIPNLVVSPSEQSLNKILEAHKMNMGSLQALCFI